MLMQQCENIIGILNVDGLRLVLVSYSKPRKRPVPLRIRTAWSDEARLSAQMHYKL